MTCVIGLRTRSSLFFATGDTGEIWTASKAGRKWLVGVDGEPRCRQTCRYLLEWPESGQVGVSSEPGFTDSDDPYVYLIRDYVPKLMETLQNHCLLHKPKEGGVSMKGSLLLGTDNRLYEIDNHFNVRESTEVFAGIGGHWERAVGSLFTTTDSRKGPKERLEIALKAAKADGFKMRDLPYSS